MADNTFYRVETKNQFGWDSYVYENFDTEDEAEEVAQGAPAEFYRNVRVRKVVESDVAVYTDGVKDA